MQRAIHTIHTSRTIGSMIPDMLRATLFAMLLLPSMAASEKAPENAPEKEEQNTAPSTYQHFADLLEAHLVEKELPNDGLVSAFDYQAALERPRSMALIQQQRRTLENFDTSSLDTREAAVAFWLNAYNFFMIAQILEEQTNDELVESVWDYGGRYNPFRDNVFDFRKFDVGGNKYSLNQMEKDILLGDEYAERGWKEARVHFAVNCASVGCPPLRAKIYTPENLDSLLTENTRRALNTPRHLHIDGDTLYLTSLFNWYEGDYIEEAGSVRDFIRQYADQRVIDDMANTSRIRYISYDWSLNRPENFPEF